MCTHRRRRSTASSARSRKRRGYSRDGHRRRPVLSGVHPRPLQESAELWPPRAPRHQPRGGQPALWRRGRDGLPRQGRRDRRHPLSRPRVRDLAGLGIAPDRAAQGSGPRGRQEDQQGRRARRAGDRDLPGAHQVRSALAQSVEGRRLWNGGRRRGVIDRYDRTDSSVSGLDRRRDQRAGRRGPRRGGRAGRLGVEQRPPAWGAARRAELDPRQPDRAHVQRRNDLRVPGWRALRGRVGDGRRVGREGRGQLSRRHEGLARRGASFGDTMSEQPAVTTDVAPDATVKPEDVIEVLRQCFDPEIPVNIIDPGLVYDIAIKPERVDVKMTLTALGCPMAADVMADVRDHLLTLPGIADAGVDIVYEPVWTPERMSEEARWELGMV